MKIDSIKLQNFRSYKELAVSFGEKNIIVGENTQGKTNLLEAISLISFGKSFRSKEAEMVHWEEDFFRVEAKVKNERTQKIEYIFEKNVGKSGRKTIKINGAKKPATTLMEGFPCIFFTPDEVDMFFAFPSSRRRHLNILLSKTNREYSRELIKYGRVLDQRNAQLKAIQKGGAKEEQLEVWDGRLAEHGSEIVRQRAQMIAKINGSLTTNYKKVSRDKKELRLSYEPSIKIDSVYSVIPAASVIPAKAGISITGKHPAAVTDSGPNSTKASQDKQARITETRADEIWAVFLKKLLESRKRDILTGATNMGPHRDDLKIMLDSRDITTFGSRGEHRSAVVALKLTEAGILKEKNGEPPLLLMDDVFSELDSERRDNLVKAFEGQQTIVTTTDLDHISESLRKNAIIYKVKAGKLTRI